MSTEAHHIPQYRTAGNSENCFECKPSRHGCDRAPTHRYAWLEREDGMWHFLTSLFADPAESTRKWSDRQCALDELTKEGWTVLRPYPEQLSMERHSRHHLNGYGLMRTVH